MERGEVLEHMAEQARVCKETIKRLALQRVVPEMEPREDNPIWWEGYLYGLRSARPYVVRGLYPELDE